MHNRFHGNVGIVLLQRLGFSVINFCLVTNNATLILPVGSLQFSIDSFVSQFLTPFHPLVGLIMPRLSNTEIGSDEYNYVHRKYRGDDYFEKVRSTTKTGLVIT